MGGCRLAQLLAQLICGVHRLADGSSLRLTVAHWLTPAGQDVGGVGLTPDLFVGSGAARGASPVESPDWALAAALSRLGS